MNTLSSTTELPLAVDLDHTLVRTDVGVESLAALMFTRPLYLLVLPFWAIRGLAYAKRRIVELVTLEFDSFPQNSEVVQFVRDERARGRKVVLVTASDQRIADESAKLFQCFDEAIGSNGTTNLKGPNKAKFLVDRYGEKRFVYVGDSSADLTVWQHSGGAVVVDYLDGARTNAAAKLCTIEKTFAIPQRGLLKLWSKQLRVHQWAKNLLLILPLILAHQVFNDAKWASVLIGVLAFSFVASTVYILNDTSDLVADRSHRTKRMRPLASGELRIESALVVAAMLLSVAALLIVCFIPQMMGITLFYFVLTCLYTWRGKEQLGLDVMMLAGLYCVRIFAGGIVANVALSQWLLTFAGFLFLSLACVKRVAELSRLEGDLLNTEGLNRRAYTLADLPTLTALGVGAGLMSVLVASLYFSGSEVTSLYRNPVVLFSGVLPVITFWISRLWLLAGRGSDKLEDPVLYAITDKVSLLCGLTVGVLVWFAI